MEFSSQSMKSFDVDSNPHNDEKFPGEFFIFVNKDRKMTFFGSMLYSKIEDGNIHQTN